MRPKVITAFLASLVVLVVGCSQSPVAPSQSPGAASAAATIGSAISGGSTMPSGVKGTDVPFSGEVTGEMRYDTTNPRGCPAQFTGFTNATGNALHMGRVTYHTEQCSSKGVHSGDLVITAANGDELHGTLTATSVNVPPQPPWDKSYVTATFTFNGGTGRFESATGQAAMTAVLDVKAGVPPFPGRWEWTGTINY